MAIKNKIDKYGIKGIITISVKDKNGKDKKIWNENLLGKIIRIFLGKDIQGFPLFGFWTNKRIIPNIVTNTGRAAMASRFNGVGAEAVFNNLAVGTGTVAAAVTDTALGAEITTGGLARGVATLSRITHTVTNDTARLERDFTATASHSVTEVGAFNAATGGVMAGRMVFAAVGIVSGDILRIVYDFRMA